MNSEIIRHWMFILHSAFDDDTPQMEELLTQLKHCKDQELSIAAHRILQASFTEREKGS